MKKYSSFAPRWCRSLSVAIIRTVERHIDGKHSCPLSSWTLWEVAWSSQGGSVVPRLGLHGKVIHETFSLKPVNPQHRALVITDLVGDFGDGVASLHKGHDALVRISNVFISHQGVVWYSWPCQQGGVRQRLSWLTKRKRPKMAIREIADEESFIGRQNSIGHRHGKIESGLWPVLVLSYGQLETCPNKNHVSPILLFLNQSIDAVQTA